MNEEELALAWEERGTLEEQRRARAILRQVATALNEDAPGAWWEEPDPPPLRVAAMSQAPDDEAHRQLLRGACLHAVRDDRRGSWLVGLELAELDFQKARSRKEAEEYLDAQLAGIRRMFMDVWDRQP